MCNSWGGQHKLLNKDFGLYLLTSPFLILLTTVQNTDIFIHSFSTPNQLRDAESVVIMTPTPHLNYISHELVCLLPSAPLLIHTTQWYSINCSEAVVIKLLHASESLGRLVKQIAEFLIQWIWSVTLEFSDGCHLGSAPWKTMVLKYSDNVIPPTKTLSVHPPHHLINSI